MSDSPDALILLPHLRVEGANAISGPLTWGFPAPSAFTGFLHALARKQPNSRVTLDGVGIVCHAFEPHVYIPSGSRSLRFSLYRQTLEPAGIREPPKVKNDAIVPPGVVEEGRAHLEVSLLIGVQGYLGVAAGERLAAELHEMAQGMRLAGGAMRPSSTRRRQKPAYIPLTCSLKGDAEVYAKLRRQLLPGFALVERHALFESYLKQRREEAPETNALDALLELVRLNIDPVAADPDAPDKVEWRASRTRPGWLVPLPIGYAAISPLYPAGEVRGTRDSETPFRFVESLYSLGEWVSPNRLHHPDDLLWYHQADPDAGTYLCTQHNAQHQASA